MSKYLCGIKGSSIYGCKINDKYLFSTAVEPDGRKSGFIKLLFGWKRGQGIKDLFSYIYAGNIDIGFTEIYKQRKDIFPFIFQFGVLVFPSGVNNSGYMLVDHVATRKHDCSAVAVSFN
jgi:hypothetical protein